MNDEQKTLVEEQILYFKVQSTIYIRAKTTLEGVDCLAIGALLKKRFEFPIFGYKDLLLAADGGTMTTTELNRRPAGCFKEFDPK